MEKRETAPEPVFSHVEPVLAVQDISATILYWQNTLGFPAKWTWGDPPVHGGVSWQKVFIQFSKNQELGAASKGNSIWIRVQNIETLYSLHQQKNAEIVAPLENKPWGMAEYTIREINGYFVHFAGLLVEREKSTVIFPPSVRIIGRTPTVEEYRKLLSAVGWSASMSDEIAESCLSAAVYAVVAQDTISGEAIGCALLLGDNASYYYVKDLMVHPDWQRKRVGTALMQELTHWLNKNVTNTALVALITGETLEPFYQQFGFAQGFSMIRYILPNEKKK